MTCQEAQSVLIHGFAPFGDEGDRSQAFERHMACCSACGARLRATEPVRRLLKRCCRRLRAPYTLRLRIAGALPHRAA
jgi:hypothetical protein